MAKEKALKFQFDSFEEHWQQNLEVSQLRLPRCENCQHWNWYPLPVCTSCQHSDFVWTDVPMNGTLFSHTKVHRAFGKIKPAVVPYIIGVVEFDIIPQAANQQTDAVVRIPCRYAGSTEDQMKIGESVNIIRLEDKNGYCWGFS